jgi:clan AA aspartic protease
MISGRVNHNLEAVVSLTIQGPNASHQIDALLDTGFSSYLTLPAAVIAALGWPWLSRHHGMLADGSVQILDAYEATVIWDSQARIVEAIAIDAAPLAGMKLLQGYELRIEVNDGGSVSISTLP